MAAWRKGEGNPKVGGGDGTRLSPISGMSYKEPLPGIRLDIPEHDGQAYPDLNSLHRGSKNLFPGEAFLAIFPPK